MDATVLKQIAQTRDEIRIVRQEQSRRNTTSSIHPLQEASGHQNYTTQVNRHTLPMGKGFPGYTTLQWKPGEHSCTKASANVNKLIPKGTEEQLSCEREQ